LDKLGHSQFESIDMDDDGNITKDELVSWSLRK
jgi:Ca2+-binding EF-hand superfamily protein